MSSDVGVALDALPSAFCSMSGTVACYEFEGNAKDGSGNGLDATTTNVAFVTGQIGQAMQVAANSNATVNANILFDNVSTLTIEAGIRPSALPTDGSVILDVLSEYVLFINPNGTFGCFIGDGEVTTTTTVSVGQWTHVACTYDGVSVNIYINGSVASMPNSGAISHSAKDMLIAGNLSTAPLIGLIDQLRLLNVARSAAEICADAGKTSCP